MRNLIAAGAAGIKRLVTPEPHVSLGCREATVIAVCASKGGVGKTTTAVHLGAGLAKLRHRRTLVVDLDPQGHVGKALEQIVPPRRGQLAELLMDTERREVVDAAVATRISDLHITAPDRALADADKSLTTRIGREFLLRRALNATRTLYDFIVLDCPPNLGNLTLNALVAADALVVPCDPSALSIQGVHDLLDAVDTIEDQLGHRAKLLGVVKTRVDRRNRIVHRQMDRAFELAYGGQLFDTEMGISTALAQAQMAGQPVYEVAPNSRGAKDYGAFVDEVLARVEGAPLSH